MLQLRNFGCKMAMIAIIAMLVAITAYAQTEQDVRQKDELKSFPAQFSIYFPSFGTQGRQSADYMYNFSLNLFYGKIGGLNGLEISGLVGVVERSVNGIQIAGLGSIVGDKMKGLQIASLASIVGDSMKGLQIAGLASIIGDNMKGSQITGLASIVGDKMKGLQIACLASIVGDKMKGLQIAGLASIVGDNMKGLQIAGLASVVGDNMKGLQIAGIYNRGGDVTGLQIGVCNRSKTLKGLQIGLISVNDSIEKGGSLSLVNIVKRGFYREWELSFSDYANVALNYRMGTQKLYTIYTVGANFIEDNLWIVGIGFGNRTSIGNRFDFRPELVSYNYYPTNFKNVQSTFATHLKFGFVYNVSEKFGLSLVPSVYVMNSNRKSGAEHYTVSPFDAFYTHEKNDNRTTIGVGVSLGLSLR